MAESKYLIKLLKFSISGPNEKYGSLFPASNAVAQPGLSGGGISQGTAGEKNGKA